MKRTGAALVIVLELAAIYAFALWVESLSGDGELELRLCQAAATACQASARVIGTWGLTAETRYHALVEAGRTI